MTNQRDALHVVLGAGQIGSRLSRLLLARGHRVRRVARHQAATTTPGLEHLAGDMTDLGFAASAAHGAAVVYDCMNPPYHQWPELLLPIARGALHGAAQAGAKLVALDCLYMYGAPDGPISEGTPLAPRSKKGELRVALGELRMAAHARGDLAVTIGRASDFFGANLPYSFWNDRFFRRLYAGKPGECVGDPDMPHSYTYVEDVAHALVTLGERDEAGGRIFHLPTNPAQTTRELTHQLGSALGLAADVRRLGSLTLRGLGLFSPMIREIAEMAYQWETPFVIDDSRFRSTFGSGPTPMDRAVAETARWANDRFGRVKHAPGPLPPPRRDARFAACQSPRAVEPDVAEHLEAAVEAVARAAWKRARGALEAAWHVKPSRRVGALVDIVDDRMPKPPIEESTHELREMRWHALALTEDPAQLSTLLGAPWPDATREAHARLQALALWPRSPRIASALRAVHERQIYRGTEGALLSRKIIGILLAQGDPAVTAYLERLDRGLDAVDREVAAALRGIMRRGRPREPKPSRRETAALESLEAAIRRPSAVVASYEDLLAAVYAAPWDDAPRAVLADLLIERDDPRGELIMLQLRRAEPATPGERIRHRHQERALLHQAGNRWFDGLDRAGAREVQLVRGFPGIATTSASSFDDPAWATIESLALDGGRSSPFTGAPTLRGLRRLYGLEAADLAALLPEPELDVASLADLDALDAPTGLAPRTLALGNLARPALHAPLRARLARLPELPIGRRVTALHLGVTIDELPLAVALLDGRLTEVRVLGRHDRFAREPLQWGAHVSRDRIQIEWRGTRLDAGALRMLLPVLAQFKRPPGQALEIAAQDINRTDELDDARRELASAARGWASATVLGSLGP